MSLSLLCQVVGTLSAPSGFVVRKGPQFVLDGKPYFFAGANVWQAAHLALRNPADLDYELDYLARLNLTNIRMLGSAEGPDSEKYRVTPSIMPAPGVYNEDVLRGLDYALAAVAKRNMKAVLMLNNFWQWSGGMSQYVSWQTGTKIPYPNDTGDWERFIKYTQQFYHMPEAQNLWKQYIAKIINRVNTVTGVVYREDPAIFSWQLANEPREYPASWSSDIAAYIKSLDPHHMVSTGSEGHIDNTTDVWIESHSDPNIDYGTCHIWPDNRGWFVPTRPETYPAALNRALATLQQHQDESITVLKKPLVLEEFGLDRDQAKYDVGSPVHYRDDYYWHMLNATVSTARLGKGGLSGAGFWGWAGRHYPPDILIGDPPHQPAGQHSVFDVDKSTQVPMSVCGTQLNALSRL